MKGSNHGPLQYVNQIDTARQFNDVAKDKHDCFIIGSEGEVRADVFTVSNRKDLLQTISIVSGKIKVGLEATGYYSYVPEFFLTAVCSPMS